MGDDIRLEFVDDKEGSSYELTTDKQRKNAPLLSGRMGMTDDELDAGATNKRNRILGQRKSGGLTIPGAGAFETAKDKPFALLETNAGMNRAPLIRFKDLEAVVTARVTYNGLPFDVRRDFIRITDQQILVPVAVRVSNTEITFKRTAKARTIDSLSMTSWHFTKKKQPNQAAILA